MTLPTTTTLNGNANSNNNNNNSNNYDDDSDMFGPPRSSPIGYHHHRSRVPMISPKLRQREERKRILQLCAHKLERIKDSETNLRRSVCINNTYCRLTDELRREKQSRYLANLPKSESKPETARDNIFNPYNSCGIDSSNHQPSSKGFYNNNNNNNNHNNNDTTTASNNNNNNNNRSICSIENQPMNNVDNHHHHQQHYHHQNNNNNNNNNDKHHTDNDENSLYLTNQPNNANNQNSNSNNSSSSNTTSTSNSYSSNSNSNISSTHSHNSNSTTMTTTTTTSNHHYYHHHHSQTTRKRSLSSSNFDNDLEILDRELNAINAPMPLIDPEITQGAEQLEKAISSRKRLRSEDESDRLVREALSQFYIPPQRLISAIEDCPLDVVGLGNATSIVNSHHYFQQQHQQHHQQQHHHHLQQQQQQQHQQQLQLHHHHHHHHLSMSPCKRQKLNGTNDLELDFDMNQNQKEFEVIMDALRLGTPSPTPSMGSDSCGQAAMMSESANVFHNLVVTSLET